jgi:hypothetical protein
MCNNQILATIYEIMKFNKISLNNLIEFIDLNESSKAKASADDISKFIKTLSSGKKMSWADEVSDESSDEVPKADESSDEVPKADESSDEVPKADESSDENSWVDVIKKTKPAKNIQVAKPKVVKSKVVKSTQKTREVIYTVDEFTKCIKNNKKLFIDFVIDHDSHCEHTFEGTLCTDVKGCGKIHLQRCINNVDCTYENCQFLHVWDMYDDQAKENYMATMNKYNQIKKNKRVSLEK